MKKKDLEDMFKVLMKIQNPDPLVNRLIAIVREDIHKLERRGKLLQKENEKYWI